MKKNLIVFGIIMILLIITATSVCADDNSKQPITQRDYRDFIFRHPYDDSLETTFDDTTPNFTTSSVYLDSFLNGSGAYVDPEHYPAYCQNTILVILDAYSYNNSSIVFVTNAVYTGTVPDVTFYFSYYAGYGPGSGRSVKLAACPVNTNFIEYGISYIWSC